MTKSYFKQLILIFTGFRLRGASIDSNEMQEFFQINFCFVHFADCSVNLFTDYDLNEYDLTHGNMLLGPSFDSSKSSCGCVHTLPLRLYVCTVQRIWSMEKDRLTEIENTLVLEKEKNANNLF